MSNFLGWYLTVYVIYQSFALWVRTRSVVSNRQPANFWRVAVLFYGVSDIGNLFVIAPPGVYVIRDASGAMWRASSILHVSALVSIFVMGAFAVFWWLRLVETGATPRQPCP